MTSSIIGSTYILGPNQERVRPNESHHNLHVVSFIPYTFPRRSEVSSETVGKLGLTSTPYPPTTASFASLKSAIFDREEKKQQYQAHIRGLNAYDRHKKFIKDYVGFYGKEKPSSVKLPVKTDQDSLREGYRFIRTEEDDMDTSWEQRLVKRYYDKLFKEYCIADMSHYKSGKIGLRWRTEKDVISGKGQVICGNKHCDEKDGLASYEVNFSYFEAGENKQALVKLVACERCAEKLNYRKRKEKEQCEKRERKEHRRRKRNRTRSEEDTENEESKEKKRKGKKTLASISDPGEDNDDHFDEFLEGMFP